MNRIIESIIVVLLMFLLVVMGFILGFLYNGQFKDGELMFGRSYSNCSGLGLFQSSYCLRDELKEFYKYNISNVGKRLNIEELKEVGGVCSHYARWYYENVIELGFNATEVTFPLDNDIAHRITIVSNNNSYCVLDQMNVGCVRLEGYNEN